jgi:16S rRNA (guanine527-N7)-methyltransferase
MMNDDRPKRKPDSERHPRSPSRPTDKRGRPDNRRPSSDSTQSNRSFRKPDAPEHRRPTSESPIASARPLKRRKKVGLPVKGRRPDAPAWIGRLDHPFKLERERVTELVERLSVDADIDRLYKHLELVKSINEEVNLVSRANVDAVLLQSLWESLIPITNQDWRCGPRVLDLGTGGGFPGFPIALALPDAQMTLLDSRRAKTLSLERMVGEMTVPNISVIHDRAETHAERIQEPYDSIFVRAVSVLPEVAEWSESLLKPGGTLLSWKGPEGEREAKALDSKKWTLKYALFVLPHRYIIVLEYLGNPTDEDQKDAGDVD